LARYNGPVCRLCRREGEKLFLKGERCFSPKCAFERRSYAPGMHGRQAQYRRKESDFALQLRAKQKARRLYGIYERQFRRYFREAQRQKGLTGVNLLILLESRLDNVVYRLGFSSSRAQARQVVLHGHFDVNGRKTNIPSYLVKPGDIIAVRDISRGKTYFKEVSQILDDNQVPAWLSLDPANLTGKMVDLPSRDDIDVSINEQLIVEYYSR
jgi:small subunit ribosomal protein S4